MKRILLFLAVLATAVLGVNAQQGQSEAVLTAPADANDGPAIEFDHDVHDFGTLDEGPKVTHEFVFTNTGSAPLVLSNVKASCGCTVPKWPREPIMPGAKSKIEVTYNTSKRPGHFNKGVTITANTAQKTKVIYIKGKVRKAESEPTTPVRSKSILAPSGS